MMRCAKSALPNLVRFGIHLVGVQKVWLVVLLILYLKNVSSTCDVNQSDTIDTVNETLNQLLWRTQTNSTSETPIFINTSFVHIKSIVANQKSNVEIRCYYHFVLSNFDERFNYIVNYRISPTNIEDDYHSKIRLILSHSNSINEHPDISYMHGDSVTSKGILWSQVVAPKSANDTQQLHQFLVLLLNTMGPSVFDIKIVVTPIKNCSRPNNTFDCGSKSCIDEALHCDGNPNCPLHSNDDESKCEEPPLFIAIFCVALIVVCLLLFISFVAYIIYKHRESRMNSMTKSNPPQQDISSFLPQAPPPYDRKTKLARPSGHDPPPTFDESTEPGVFAPTDFAKRYFAPRESTFSLDGTQDFWMRSRTNSKIPEPLITEKNVNPPKRPAAAAAESSSRNGGTVRPQSRSTQEEPPIEEESRQETPASEQNRQESQDTTGNGGHS